MLKHKLIFKFNNFVKIDVDFIFKYVQNVKVMDF